MIRKCKAFILAAMILAGSLLTISQTAASASTRPCGQYDFYAYSGWDSYFNDGYDAYYDYTICDGGYVRYNYTFFVYW